MGAIEARTPESLRLKSLDSETESGIEFLLFRGRIPRQGVLGLCLFLANFKPHKFKTLKVNDVMIQDTSWPSVDVDQCQRLLAANTRTLAYIAQRAPLVQILTSIINGIEDQGSDMWGAILVLDAGSNRLSSEVAPSLPQDYLHAIHDIDLNLEADVRQGAAGRITTIEASRFWPDFRDQALRHGLHACAAFPIESVVGGLLGVFVVYSQADNPVSDGLRQIVADASVLAVIAIERAQVETWIENTEGALIESETRMALAIEGSGTGIWDRNIATGEIHYSAGWWSILGYTGSEPSNRIEESYKRVHPDDLAFVQAAIQDHLDGKAENYVVEHRIRCKDGHYKWIASRGKVVSRDADGKPLRMIGTTADISTLRTLSDRLQQSVDLVTNLTNEVPGLVYEYRQLPSGAAYFPYASKGIQDIYELTPKQVADNASLVDAIIHPDDFPAYRASLAASATSLQPWHLEYRVILPDQGLRWRRGDARPSRLPDGSTVWHGFIIDATDRKTVEIKLQEFATTDYLTQLPNRRHFMAQMEQELVRVRNFARVDSAVLMCDLDHFKAINDRYGHAVGDQVLKFFATILRTELRKSDMVGRVGGEEFAVILPDVGVIEASVFARRVQMRVARAPLPVGNESIVVTLSIGISLIRATDKDAECSLLRSDEALYRAKGSGRNRIEIAPD